MSYYTAINRRPEEAFPGGYRFYDEGVSAFEAGEDFSTHSSRSWRDGWRDAESVALSKPRKAV